MLRPGIHRILDFVTVAAFAVAPTVFDLRGAPAVISYILAAVHLLLTLATNFPGSARRPIPIGIHAVVELIVGVALVVLPWLAGWPATARTFFVTAGFVILGVWVLSSYSERRPRRGAA